MLRLGRAPEDEQTTLSAEAQAVYRCFGQHGQLLYVGVTGHLGRRLADHAQKLWFPQVHCITLEWHADRLSAEQAERQAIYTEQPRYNVAGKTFIPFPVRRPPARRLPGASARPQNPAAPPARHRGHWVPVAARKASLTGMLDEAPDLGVSPHELVTGTGLSRAYVHFVLAALVERGDAVRLGYGRYRMSPGVTAGEALERYYAERLSA